jgi:hypothetical protein
MTLPSDLQRLLPFIAVALLAVVGLFLVVRGVGGGGDGANSAQKKLHVALTELPKSGKGSASVNVTVDLARGGGTKTERFAVTTTGSYVDSKSKDPFALGEDDSTTRQTQNGKTVVTRAIAVDEHGYLQAGGRWYELSKGQARRVFNDEETGRRTTSLKEADFDVEAWTQAPRLDGTARVDGVDVERITGTLNVDAMLASLDNASDDGDGSIQRTFADAQKQGEIELLVGKNDGLLRKASVTGQAVLQGPGGAARMTIRFDIAIREPGKPQKITAPSNALPVGRIKDVPRSALGEEKDAIYPAGKGSGSGGSSKGGSGNGNRSGSKRSTQAYVGCVQQATDTAALERCQAFLPRR